MKFGVKGNRFGSNTAARAAMAVDLPLEFSPTNKVSGRIGKRVRRTKPLKFFNVSVSIEVAVAPCVAEAPELLNQRKIDGRRKRSPDMGGVGPVTEPPRDAIYPKKG